MQVILSHLTLDFDGFASMLAAKKLYPEAKLVITDKQNAAVKQFLALYRDSIELSDAKQIDWSDVRHLILVDVANAKRVGPFMEKVNLEQTTVTIFDHHPPKEDDIEPTDAKIEAVGATVTLLIEEIIANNIPITSFEATVFGLGLYTDTGSFSYTNTTARDLNAASFLLKNGMNLELINRFSDQMLFDQQQDIFNSLLINSQEYSHDGLTFLISWYEHSKFQGGLATLTRKLMETSGADAVFTIVAMQKRIYVVARSSTERIHVLPIIKSLGGGGHAQAASATIKTGNISDIYEQVKTKLTDSIRPAITAKEMMSSPVKVLSPETTIDEAAERMIRYGHTGFPIVDDEQLAGIISRRDLDKATHHGLGHAPVKAYMSTSPISITSTTSLEEIQKIMIKHNVGRLPVTNDGKIVGIVSRTNVIEVLHNQTTHTNEQSLAVENVNKQIEKQLPSATIYLLQCIGKTADKNDVDAYLIGGIVRDLLLGLNNEDIDIVVDGNGIEFAEALQERYGGTIKAHQNFGTATWTSPSGVKVDVTSSRIEYYEHPAALPTVERSSIKQDLYRRDFSINAMAIQLNEHSFGDVLDYFNGIDDLTEKRIRVLHNLSFVEDPTRILRAVRFELRFGFEMDQHTFELAETSVDQVALLSKQRVIHELKSLLTENEPITAIERLRVIGFWDHLIGQNLVLNHTLTLAKQIQKTSKNQCKNLKPQHEEGKTSELWFCYFISLFYGHEGWEHKVAAYAMHRKHQELIKQIVHFDEEKAKGAFTLANLHYLFKHFHDEAILFIAAKEENSDVHDLIITYVKKWNDFSPLLTGTDLKQAGIQPGPIFSKILLAVEVAYLQNQISTKNDAIQWLHEHLHRFTS
ncbi:CBS domain-containing protein [Desertibacillus haloalkaliphilus]|uniref:CBS domain-containing protein n=1 Tax=Desertibacillus haloalkaliphilus TaxID=1328930 RepID=UPI001C272EDD|nr:CBS domain-containing protein [Desertibacillus haloalkaliphilus]MBU8908957.1 CBS domain-containing protein [Desertibacillus haloalkaliphilus]